MKLCFSTLACPEWSFNEIKSAALDLGYDGIEIRGVEKNLLITDIPEFSDINARKTVKDLSERGIEIPIFSSDCYLCDTDNIDSIMDNAVKYIDTAYMCRVPYVRVLCDYQPAPSKIDFRHTLNNLVDLATYAADMDITLLVETNGYFADSTKMRKLLDQVEGLPVMVLWDIHHTYRYYSESPEKTYDILGEYIQHVHVKDSILKNNKVEYKMVGEGDIPVVHGINLLKENDYAGFISLEWVRRWDLGLEDSGIVLPHFIRFMKEII